MGVWELVNKHYEKDIPFETREVAEAYAVRINSYALNILRKLTLGCYRLKFKMLLQVFFKRHYFMALIKR
jgi:hypothetical protein